MPEPLGRPIPHDAARQLPTERGRPRWPALPIRFPQARGGPPGPLDAATRAFLQAREERRSGPRGPWIAPVRRWLRQERDTPREERTAMPDDAPARAGAISGSDQRTGRPRRRAGLPRAGPPSACGYRRRWRTPARRRETRGTPGTRPGVPPRRTTRSAG